MSIAASQTRSDFAVQGNSTSGITVEPGSFRDREARVFYHSDKVYRGLSPRALANFNAVQITGFFGHALRARDIVASKLCENVNGLAKSSDWAGVLEHECVPFVSYPYEWSFSMLRDAALLQLDLTRQALSDDIELKDASAYNIQFLGARPIFIDVASFEPYIPGNVWLGYRQFCEMFLYPLMLASYKQIDFHALLRGNLEGVPVSQMYQLISCRDLFRRGVFAHVYLQKRIHDGVAARPEGTRKNISQAGFHKDLIQINLGKLRALIGQLPRPAGSSVWVDYATHNSYEASDQQFKQEFITQVVSRRKHTLVWDLGCNTGVFSRIAAKHSDYVVAMDSDVLSIERLYSELRGDARILPLVMNVANPSPNQGWAGVERKDLGQRGRPSLIMALALIHHLVISANIPAAEFIAYLRGFGAELAIEFVTKADPMVKKLLANKDDNYSDYELDSFEAILRKHYCIARREELQSGTRVLYHCTPI